MHTDFNTDLQGYKQIANRDFRLIFDRVNQLKERGNIECTVASIQIKLAPPIACALFIRKIPAMQLPLTQFEQFGAKI